MAALAAIQISFDTIAGTAFSWITHRSWDRLNGVFRSGDAFFCTANGAWLGKHLQIAELLLVAEGTTGVRTTTGRKPNCAVNAAIRTAFGKRWEVRRGNS